MNAKEQLAGLVARIERQQKALGLNDSQFVERYGRWIGSTKTWRERFLAGAFDDLRLDRWQKRLTALVTELDGGSVADEFFDLPFVRAYNAQLSILQRQHNDRRCLVVLGVTGVGKTAWARRHCADHPRETAYVKARLGWRNSPASISNGIARAIGCREAAGAIAALDSVVEALRGSRLTVFMDDAHEGGIALMKIVKTLIDETPSRFVLLAYRTGTPALKPLRGWTWAKVLDKLRTHRGWKKFVRVSEEVDKEAILARRKSLSKVLELVGVRVEQAETFYVEAQTPRSA